MSLKPVALTLGEPAGVGGEIALKAWDILRSTTPFFLIADIHHMSTLSKNTGIPVVEISTPAEISDQGLSVIHHALPAPVVAGLPNEQNAPEVVAMIERAVNFVKGNEACALTTNPIHKKALKDGADFPYPGHTEFLAYLGGVNRSVMMLATPELRVVPVTIHIALEQVAIALTPALIEETIRITAAALQSNFGISAPRIAVAGLNPHAGEGGTMGTDEIETIIPVLSKLRAEGLKISGPLSADTMFHDTARAQYDVAICMYHDQALIPIKTINFAEGVNITLGLPFIRTSPDHGTAFDIAGQNIADPRSLVQALRMATEMSKAKQKS